MSMCAVFLLMLVTGEAFMQVTALKCYECTQSDLTSCGDRFNGSKVTVTNCNQSIYTIDDVNSEKKEYACMFVKETDSNNTSKYTRRCSAKNLNDTCENLISKNKEVRSGIRTECRQCNTDLCNSALTVKSDLQTLFVLSVIIIKCSFLM